MAIRKWLKVEEFRVVVHVNAIQIPLEKNLKDRDNQERNKIQKMFRRQMHLVGRKVYQLPSQMLSKTTHQILEPSMLAQVGTSLIHWTTFRN